MSGKKVFRIGVLSDTHDRELPEAMLNDFKKVDMIIHVGDFCELSVYKALQKIKPVHAVSGNMDSQELCAQLSRKEIITCGKFHIGLFHGEGAPQGILERVQNRFKGVKVDAVIFGHSHVPFNENIDGVLYFNPGSPTDDIYAPYLSYGIMELSGEDIAGRIVKVKEPHG